MEHSFEIETSENASYKFFLDKEKKQSLLEISDYDLLETREIINKRQKYFLIEF